jgi:hypothetical protein
MLYTLLFGKKKKKKKKKQKGETARGLFSPGQTRPISYAIPEISPPLGAIKSCLRVVLEFYVHLMCWQSLFGLETTRVTQVWFSYFKLVSGVMELRNSDSLPYIMPSWISLVKYLLRFQFFLIFAYLFCLHFIF